MSVMLIFIMLWAFWAICTFYIDRIGYYRDFLQSLTQQDWQRHIDGIVFVYVLLTLFSPIIALWEIGKHFRLLSKATGGENNGVR